MTVSTTVVGRERRRAFNPVLAIGAALAATVAGTVTVWPLLSLHPFVALPSILYGSALVFAGAVLVGERGQGASAAALVVAGILWPFGWFDYWGGGPAPVVSTYASPLALVVGAAAMYRYPDPNSLTLSHGCAREKRSWTEPWWHA